ncbi:MAG: flagellar motor switch protein FliG [Acidobacteria bacterium RIFCSPLOWO2_12_FULL_67_14b]|nr:MAG: flagellar motor switch protein FliG [Acidobacteria bacterium RIFCSPLOWO2_12_FULL_67_14b]
MATPAKPISGARKAAIIMMALGEEASSKLFKHLQEEEIERIAKEVASLGKVGPELGEQVLVEFHQMTAASDYITSGGVEHARRLLSKAMGPDMSRRILDRVIRSVNVSAGFQTLEKANPLQLSKFILGEHPQTIALILAHLNATSAAQLVTQLPEEMQADVLMRMAKIEDIPPEVISRISSVIDQRLKALGGPSREQHGGVRAVAELFNQLERGVSQPALERIESQSQDLAVQIRNLMFVFEDLLGIEDVGIREIVNRADKKSLTVALKGASEDIRQRFFGNMSKRSGELLKEEMEIMGAVRLRDVEKAQQEIVAIARKLEEEGVITTGAGAGEPYVV